MRNQKNQAQLLIPSKPGLISAASHRSQNQIVAPCKKFTVRQSLQRHSHFGFTLVELMTGMAASAIILLAVAMTVASIGEQYGATFAERRMRDSLNAVLALLERDIRVTGRGLPPDLLTQGPINLAVSQAEIAWFYNNLFRDVNSTNAPDQLWLSGAGMDASPNSERTSFVVGYANPNLTILRSDGGGVPAAWTAGLPSTAATDLPDVALFAGFGLGLPMFYVSILNQQSGFLSAAPLAIQAIAPVANALGEHDQYTITLQNPADLAAQPQAGQQVFFSQVIRNADGTYSTPEHLQQARWYWVASAADPNVGTLYRHLVADPTDPPSGNPTVDGVPVLDNVVDFQVAFLVWPCGAAGPTWIDHALDAGSGSGHFAGAPYRAGNSAANMADRLLALRERLMAVRVTFLLREALPKPGLLDDVFGPAPQAFVNEDRALNPGAQIDNDYRHFVVQRIYDPVALRVSTSSEDPDENFPKVRSIAVDASTRDLSTGVCTGRRQS